MTNEQMRYKMLVRVVSGFYHGCFAEVVGIYSTVSNTDRVFEWQLRLNDGSLGYAKAEEMELVAEQPRGKVSKKTGLYTHE